MMSLNQLQTQALGSIADGLAGSDPRLASMLTIFSRLAAGEEMPAREKRRVRRRRPAAHRPRPAAPAPGHSTPATAPPAPAAGPAAGHAGAGGRHLRRTAHHRADPQRQRPQDLRPVAGNGVHLALHPTACRRGQTLMHCAEMTGAAAKLAARWSPGCGRSARGSGPLPYRLALAVCQQIAAGDAQLLRSRGVVELSCWRRPTRSCWRWLRGGPWSCYHQLFAVLLRFDGRG